jgi:3-oxoacid CoA-transferase subunit B
MTPGQLVKSVCRAIDLVASVGMNHTSKHGESKVPKCILPLIGLGVVNRIITDLGVFDVVEGGLRIVELADGVTEADARAATEAKIV